MINSRIKKGGNMIIKFKNGSTIETIERKNDFGDKYYILDYSTKPPSKELRGQCAEITGIDKLYGFKFRWYQKLYLRFLDSRLMRWVYRFKRYDI